MLLAGDGDHVRAEIHADPGRRLERREELTRPASQFKDPHPLGNEEAHVSPVVLVIEPVADNPAVSLVGGAVRMLEDSPLSGRKRLQRHLRNRIDGLVICRTLSQTHDGDITEVGITSGSKPRFSNAHQRRRPPIEEGSTQIVVGLI